MSTFETMSNDGIVGNLLKNQVKVEVEIKKKHAQLLLDLILGLNLVVS